MIKSRFKFHGELITATLLGILSLVFIIKLWVEVLEKKAGDRHGIIVFIILTLGIALACNIYSILRIPALIIFPNSIILKTAFFKREIPLTGIESIILTGKKNFAVWTNAEEISTLILKTGEKIFIRIECYQNSPEIRVELQRISQSLSLYNPEKTTTSLSNIEEKSKSVIPVLSGESFIKYSGKPLLSFNAILFYGLVAFLLISTATTLSLYPARIPLLIIPIVFFYFIIGFQLHYFLLSNDQLIIKNAFLPWEKKIYSVTELQEIVFEIPPGKMSNPIRVITKNFTSKRYPAEGLKKRDWKELKKHLESLGVKIRDEIGI